MSVSGFAGLPTLHRPDAAQQYLFVNGRPVKDKLLIGAVRAAYGDLIPRGRHPLLALFVALPPHEVDVNVHPAKAEVRFRDAALVRSLIVNALAAALHAAGHRASVGGGAATLGEMRPNIVPFERPRGIPPPLRSRLPKRCRRLSRHLPHQAPTRAPMPRRSPKPCSTGRSALPARNCTRPISWRRRATPSSSSTSTPRTSAWSTSA